MRAQGYIANGYCFEAGGWTVTLEDGHDGCDQMPVAVHHDGPGCWLKDWQVSPLENLWDDYPALIQAPRLLLAAGRLRVAGAVHGLPGASPLGALLC